MIAAELPLCDMSLRQVLKAPEASIARRPCPTVSPLPGHRVLSGGHDVYPGAQHVATMAHTSPQVMITTTRPLRMKASVNHAISRSGVFALASWRGEIFPRRQFSRWQVMRDAMRVLQQLRTEGGHCLGSNLRPFLLKGNLLEARSASCRPRLRLSRLRSLCPPRLAFVSPRLAHHLLLADGAETNSPHLTNYECVASNSCDA
jgi:hypothetical protein